MIDPQVNFFSSTLVGTYSASDTSLTIATGSGELLPDPSVDGEFNLVIYNESEIGVVTTYDGGSTDTREDLAGTNPEIVRVTARSGDVLTVTRGQEGTTASVKEEGNTYRVILSATKKVFDDIQTAIENVDLTTLTGVEELTFDSTGDEEFGLPAGTTAQRPASPSAGYMRFNTDTTRVEVYDGSNFRQIDYFGVDRALGVATATVTSNDAEFLAGELEYLVVAGGGGGGCGVQGDSSGGGGAGAVIHTDEALPFASATYTISIGAGGAGGTSENGGTNGSDTYITFDDASQALSKGGGGGGAGDDANDGGSGGGGAREAFQTAGVAVSTNIVPSGTTVYGNDGGDGQSGVVAGGGGGAGEVGNTDGQGDGGDGIQINIDGNNYYWAGGGGGGASSNGGDGGLGGGGGGPRGGVGGGTAINSGETPSNDSGGDGGGNTGGGGGGGLNADDPGGNGGSGVVILRYPSFYSITIGAGLTGSETTDGSEKYAVITAGTGNVSWST